MITEFMGCTGSGKTSLVGKVYSQLVGMGLPVVRVRDCVRGRKLLGWIPREGLQNVVLELGLTPAICWALPQYSSFLTFAYRAVRRHADSRYLGFKAYRGVWRQVGLHALLQRKRFGSPVVLVDEGTIHTAHYIFVQTGRFPDETDLDTFCRLVPRPDLIVYVEAPRAILVERMRRRADPPRRGMSAAQMERVVDHGLAVFQYMRMRPLAASGRQIVCSNGPGLEALDDSAERIVESILRERPDAQSRP